ncbi:putative nuclease HARBI1 [Esox lucius]|uniref:putative nuclease HARBI1 n=1 Tax=Esox lucius TaxID=8010 RepID=UPI001476C40E|nr:putative nuclease HARBI1 [Esox lucius]
MRLTNIVARWPGSTHDSYILTNSMVGMRLQAGRVRDGWLLGDSGYPLKTWLLTPLTNPQTDRERRYNDAHSRTRSVVERAIGQLKCRWRCLDRTGGMLLYRPDKNSMRQDTARWTGFSTGGNIRDTGDAGLNGLWLLRWCRLGVRASGRSCGS